MLRNTALKIIVLLAGLSGVSLAAFQRPAFAERGGTPPPQLTISKVVANGIDTPNPTLAIEGSNFGSTASVYMGASGGTLVQLTVLSATNNFINAQLTGATSAPGTYLLVVSRGPSTTDVFSIAITIGSAALAGQGLSGPQGRPGPAGATGATGPAGPAGQTGATGPQGPIGLTGAAGAVGPVGPMGSTGSTGPMGPMGLMGPTGPTGANGLAGLKWQGAWNSGTTYAFNDAVSYNGSSFISIQAGTNQTPDTSPTFWSLLAQMGAAGATGPAGATGATGATGPAGATGATGAAGPTGPMGPAGPMGPNGLAGLTWQGAWNSGTTYALNDAVSYNGSSFISIQAGTNQAPDTSPTFWSLLAQMGAAGTTGPAGVNGAAGEAGPTGPTGPAGPTGPTGPTGPGGAPGTSGPTFLVTGVTPGNVTKWWTGTGSFYTAQSFTSSGEEPARGAPMPLACNLSTIAMYASTNKRGVSDTTDTITLTIYKNNVATAMTCSSTSTTTVHQAVSNTCTSNPVSFNAGDTLGLEWTHSNPSFTLFTQYAAGLRCQ